VGGNRALSLPDYKREYEREYKRESTRESMRKKDCEYEESIMITSLQVGLYRKGSHLASPCLL